jgi:hypothetical protein
MNRHQRGFTLFELLWGLVGLAAGIGWLMNIYKIVTDIPDTLQDPGLILFVLRVVGVPLGPIGAILGFM